MKESDKNYENYELRDKLISYFKKKNNDKDPSKRIKPETKLSKTEIMQSA